MKCPIDDSVLQMSDRNGIEIDYCPQCRGVWLDRGELDKIIDRAASASPTPPTPAPAPAPQQHQQPPQHQPQQRYDTGYYKKKKKESFLSELFDF